MGNPNALTISREPISLYGNLEQMIRAIRAHNPLDLTAENWRKAHPNGTHVEWREIVRNHILQHLHYNPGPVDLHAETRERIDRGEFFLEKVAFNTTPWIRVNGYLLLPKAAPEPMPGLVVFHGWGGPMAWGKDRIVNSGRNHPLLVRHRQRAHGGNYLAEEFAKQGYAVIVIDAHHFGERAPRGLSGLPAEFDPYELSEEAYAELDLCLREQLYLGVRQLNWAGTTWMGVNFWDDSRCIDYLQSRPEVDGNRIGCTGLSGGGWRTNMLAALDDRIKASVSAGWMTTGDYQQIYSVNSVIGTFCLLPGVWDRLDVPDLTIMAAPNASMVISNSEDQLFPVEAQDEAARQIAAGFEWAGVPEKFANVNLPKPHCYDAELQRRAFEWFDLNLIVCNFSINGRESGRLTTNGRACGHG